MSVPLGIGLARAWRPAQSEASRRQVLLQDTVLHAGADPLVASTIVWQGFLNGSTGWLAQTARIRASGAGLVYDPSGRCRGSSAGIWGIGNMMLIFLARLQGIPSELYEAVKVDGGGLWARFRHDGADDLAGPLHNILIAIIGVSQFQPRRTSSIRAGTGAGRSTLFFNIIL
jgi:multiple sugar transport system permease protein